MRSGYLEVLCSRGSLLRRLGYGLLPSLLLFGCDNDPQAPDALSPAPAPGLVAASTILSFRQVSAGGHHTCGVTTDDVAYCWGLNDHGQVGDGTTAAQRERPVRVAGTLHFRVVSAGEFHTCGLTTDNRAYCWGWNFNGALGIGSTQTNGRRPLAVATDRRFRSLSAGYFQTCAVTSADRAFCWGSNQAGQIGDGTRKSRFTPVPVLGGLNFRTINAGTDHTCGVTPGSKAYCWGSNLYGEVGDGTTATMRLKPAAVAGQRSFRQVAAGDRHSRGVTTGNAGYCWGWNLYGQVGDGTHTDRRAPRAVVGGLTFNTITAGGAHSCGLRIDHNISCWGHNSSGQLGNGTNSDQSKPLDIYGGFQWRNVDAGMVHTCAVTTDDVAYCWGSGTHGQIGDGGAHDNHPWPALVVPPS